jgi:hypothetical protein
MSTLHLQILICKEKYIQGVIEIVQIFKPRATGFM